jgi:hypothetical protein
MILFAWALLRFGESLSYDKDAAPVSSLKNIAEIMINKHKIFVFE